MCICICSSVKLKGKKEELLKTKFNSCVSSGRVINPSALLHTTF